MVCRGGHGTPFFFSLPPPFFFDPLCARRALFCLLVMLVSPSLADPSPVPPPPSPPCASALPPIHPPASPPCVVPFLPRPSRRCACRSPPRCPPLSQSVGPPASRPASLPHGRRGCTSPPPAPASSRSTRPRRGGRCRVASSQPLWVGRRARPRPPAPRRRSASVHPAALPFRYSRPSQPSRRAPPTVALPTAVGSVAFRFSSVFFFSRRCCWHRQSLRPCPLPWWVG